MSREKELVKNVFLLFLGRLLPKLVQIITLPIITACLTKSEYGTYDLITTAVMLLMPIATLQIQSAAFRFLIDYRNDDLNSSAIITNILAVVCIVALIVSIGIVIFTPKFALPFKIALALYFYLDILEATVAQIARGLGNTKAYSISSIVLAWINAAGIVIALKLMSKGLMGMIISLAAAYMITIVYLCLTLKLWKYISINALSRKLISEMASYSWPMIPNNLSNWVLKMSDRWVITAFLGVEATAVYGVANKIPNILAIAHSAIVNAWQESASVSLNDSDATEYYSKIYDRIYCLTIGITAILIGFTPVLFKLLIRGDYADSYIQMPILILAMFFFNMSGFQGGFYVAHKKTKSVGITTMVAAGINLAIDLLLVKRIGITAGAFSTLVAYLALFVFRTVDSRRFQPINYNLKKHFLLLSIIVIMLVLCFQRHFYLNCINAFAGIVLFFIINRALIVRFTKRVLNIIRKKGIA